MVEKCRFFGGHFSKLARRLDNFDCITEIEYHINLSIPSEKINFNSGIHVESIGKHYSNVLGYLHESADSNISLSVVNFVDLQNFELSVVKFH